MQIFNRYVFSFNEFGNEYIVDKPLLSDSINFRKQIFGIMAACNTFDLMCLATNNPMLKKVVGYYINGLQILENESKMWLTYDKQLKKYTCNKIDKNKLELFKKLIINNLANIFIENGQIEKIISQSGCFQMLFNSKGFASFYVTKQLYYGFGYPFNTNEGNLKDIKTSSIFFTSFIVSLMKFYQIDDLLYFGGKIEKYPKVELKLDENNKVTSITSPVTGLGLFISKSYEIVNIENDAQKRLEKQK